MDDASGLFTLSSLATLQGGAAASVLVPNVLGFLIGRRFTLSARKWASFLVAMAVALIAATVADQVGWEKWVIAFLNGFLIFASAVGINEASATAVENSASQRPDPGMLYKLSDHPSKRFFETWFKRRAVDPPPPTKSQSSQP